LQEGGVFVDSYIPLADIMRFLRRGLLSALLSALIVGALAYFVSKQLPEQYDARASLLIAQNNPDFRSLGVPTASVPVLDASAYRKAVLSSPVVKEAMTALGIKEEDQTTDAIENFRDTITIHVEPAQDSSLLDIILQAPSAKGALEGTNALAQALVNWEQRRASDSILRAITSLEEQIEMQNQQISSMRVDGVSEDQVMGRINLRAQQQDQLAIAQTLRDSARGLVSILEPALEPSRPVAPRPVFNTIIAAVLTALLAYGLLHLRETLDTRLAGSDDIAKQSGLPVLASFAKLPQQGKQLPNEGVSYLRTNLLYGTPVTTSQVILVTSAKQGEGKSSVAVSLAENFAKNNYHTLLVDADLRNPEIAKVYNMKAERLDHTSLETWLRNPLTAREVVRLPLDEQHHLYVVPSFQFSSQAASLLSVSFHDCLESWRKEYDVIVIDSAAVLEVADTLAMAPLATSTLMVVNQQKTNRRDLKNALELLKRIGVRLAGVVATDLKDEGTFTAKQQSKTAAKTPALQREGKV
jgi:polysaccharide biosynthesis transport protein